MTWVGTSWKMTKTLAEARDFISEVLAAGLPDGVQPFVLPAHTALASVRDQLPTDSALLLGAQNAHWAAEGAGTGEISMRMAADAGATMIEMGHSERRADFGETDDTVSRKARAAVDADLIPLICVGEPLMVRQAGQAEQFIRDQVTAALSLLTPTEISQVIIAYEPIWAIGVDGIPATTEQIAPIMARIHQLTDDLGHGHGLRALLYGGSVNTDNAASLLDDPHTDGLFIGRAAWQASGFLALLRIAAEHGRSA